MLIGRGGLALARGATALAHLTERRVVLRLAQLAHAVAIWLRGGDWALPPSVSPAPRARLRARLPATPGVQSHERQPGRVFASGLGWVPAFAGKAEGEDYGQRLINEGRAAARDGRPDAPLFSSPLPARGEGGPQGRVRGAYACITSPSHARALARLDLASVGSNLSPWTPAFAGEAEEGSGS